MLSGKNDNNNTYNDDNDDMISRKDDDNNNDKSIRTVHSQNQNLPDDHTNNIPEANFDKT